MLPFGVTIPGTVPQRSEFPEGIMNYPVLLSLFVTEIFGYQMTTKDSGSKIN
jgi:hypothetical protein